MKPTKRAGIIDGEHAALGELGRRIVMDFIALTRHGNGVSAVYHEGSHAMIAVLVFAQHLISGIDVTRFGGEIPIPEESIHGRQTLPQAHHVIGVAKA